MKELSYFGSSKLSLLFFLDGVSDELDKHYCIRFFFLIIEEDIGLTSFHINGELFFFFLVFPAS